MRKALILVILIAFLFGLGFAYPVGARHDTVGPLALPLEGIGGACSQDRECETDFCEGGDSTTAPANVHDGTCQFFARAASCTEYCQALRTEDPRDNLAQPKDLVCICNPLQSDELTDIVNNVLTILFNFALVLTPIMVVIAGIMFVTAAGDPSRVSRAKQILIWTAVGFVVILVARGLVLVLRTIIGF